MDLETKRKHRLTRKIWNGFKRRCFNTKDPGFHRYGGRGITVDPRWLYSFEEFLKDMGYCPLGYSLERIDVNGNYCPENCKWMPRNLQAKNRRDTIWVVTKEGRFNVSDIAKSSGLSESTIRRRFHKGWPMSMVAAPYDTRKIKQPLIDVGGVKMSIIQVARLSGLPPSTPYRRMKRGLPQSEWFK